MEPLFTVPKGGDYYLSLSLRFLYHPPYTPSRNMLGTPLRAHWTTPDDLIIQIDETSFADEVNLVWILLLDEFFESKVKF